MEILITESVSPDDGGKGYRVSFSSRQGKRQIHESDFFPDGNTIELKIQQLKKLLRQHFDTNP